MDLITERDTKQRQLDKAILDLRGNGTAFAESERDYKVLLRTNVLPNAKIGSGTKGN